MTAAAAVDGPPWPEAWWAGLGSDGRTLWRGVEAQHVVATMKLVDDLDEQLALEAILEASKPPLPPQAAGLHYLLASPFRYPSRHPSRFRVGGAPGIWYGAETVETACTELGYWRWRFLTDSDGLREQHLIVELTLFVARVHGRLLDLGALPWDTQRARWRADDYADCQALAAEAHARGLQWIRYWSARDREGHCAAVLDPAALVGIDLGRQQTWVCKVTAQAVFMRHDAQSLSLRFG